ncbi:MAG TPA: hypothetical protein VKX34_07305 [Aequorivita sp.]|nr:hypothetical protein [Aequorivita sp.]
MRRQIFLYLFLFALLLLIFQYMNEKTIYEAQDLRIQNLSGKLDKSTDSITKLNERVGDLNYFTLQGNDNAMTYLENLGYESEELEKYIFEKVYEQNLQEGNNPLVPFEGINGEMKINKLKFLNHKWILADFTDGNYWGEMILEYNITENGDIDFKTISSLIYPQ